MIIKNILVLFYTLIIVFEFGDNAEISYNLPNLSTCVKWNPNGTTFITDSAATFRVSALFIDKSNNIFITNSANRRIYKWSNSSNISDTVQFDYRTPPSGLFILSTNDIYIGDAFSGQIYRWIETTKTIEKITRFCDTCASIFISIYDTIYCSISSHHQIIAKSILYEMPNLMIVTAGVGFAGYLANMLKYPQGIFVNINLDLYVADTGNNRIQLFYSDHTNAITIAGTLDTIVLNRPTNIVLDANNYIYIVDGSNHRIIASTSYGFECIISCTETGYSSDKLNFPTSIAFDSFGNIYTTDRDNKRIQKFLLSNNTCNSTDYRKMSTISTLPTDISTIVQQIYGFTLTTESSMYLEKYCNGPKYFYKNLQINVSIEGNHNILINSTKELSVRLYKYYFDLADQEKNLLFSHDILCNINEIKFTSYFHSNETYNLIISTISSNTTFSFSLILTGPSYMNLTDITEYALNRVRSVYMSNLTSNSYICNPSIYDLLNYNCEVIKINIIEAGTYIINSESTMDLYGHIFGDDFTLLDLTINGIKNDDNSDCNKQFKISLDSQINTSFILVVRTSQRKQHGSFSIIINGPNNVTMKRIDNIPSIVQLNYSSELKNSSPKHDHLNCERLDYYYEAFSINVYTSGYYLFSSNSSFHTDAYLHKHFMNPYNSTETFYPSRTYIDMINIRIVYYLQQNITYVFVVTTSKRKQYSKGLFTIHIHGPDRVHMKNIDEIPLIEQSIYESQLTKSSPRYNVENCLSINYHYEVMQIVVSQSGTYSFTRKGDVSLYGFLYTQYFNPFDPFKRLISNDSNSCDSLQFKLSAHLKSNIIYILVVSTSIKKNTGNFTILITGPSKVNIYPLNLQTMYSSQLTKDSQIYPRICGRGNYYYETIEINVHQNGSYMFDNNDSILLYGYLYENNFDPSYSMENLITQSNYNCSNPFKLSSYLEMNRTYILLITTFDPNVRTSFTLFITGPNNVTLNKIIKKHSSCVVGDQCSLYTKGIGLTINDILRNQIQSNISFSKQSSLIQIAAVVTMIMFLIGIINGIFALVTFRNKEVRKVGCGIYLFASSITSVLTITMSTIKFWLIVFMHIHLNMSASILRADCVFIGSFLKLCLYLDGWLNACVAIERTVSVSKGVNFDKKMSRHMARRIIFILPILILGTIVHEPIQHELFDYTIQKYKLININNNLTVNISMENDENERDEIKNQTLEYRIEHHTMCIIRYSRSLQNYNTVILFFHLIVPFIANLCSAIFIIVGTARQRSTAQNKQTFKEHAFKQLKEHRQLLISPIVLLILAVPRLILSFVSGCVDPSNNPSLYLCGYFISYTPPMFIFAVFVLPSELYTKTFKESITRWVPRRIRR